ncbi:MAG: hypothetical protein FWB74_00305 [Defluviitaleaceae bacterium]|nr:hypothetical protein [Defluviitaleaceae bacterium]
MDEPFMIVAGFSFENVKDSDFGKPFLYVVDLKDEQQRAQFIFENGNLVEKVSTFSDIKRQDKLNQILAINFDEIRGEFSA